MGRFGSVVTAMVTPFDGDGTLDIDGAVALADHLVGAGSDGLVLAGTTGEGPVLSDGEALELFRAVAGSVNVPVIASTGSNDTAHTVAFTQSVAGSGVDGVLVVTPYYNRPSAAGLTAHFRTVAAATDLPVVLYDIPIRTGRRIGTDLLIELAGEVPNIVGREGFDARPGRRRPGGGRDPRDLRGLLRRRRPHPPVPGCRRGGDRQRGRPLGGGDHDRDGRRLQSRGPRRGPGGQPPAGRVLRLRELRTCTRIRSRPRPPAGPRGSRPASAAFPMPRRRSHWSTRPAGSSNGCASIHRIASRLADPARATPAKKAGNRGAGSAKAKGSGHQPKGSGHQPQGSGHQPKGSGHQAQGSGHQPKGSGAKKGQRQPESSTGGARRKKGGAPVRIVFLGGLGEIGRNCACIEVDGRILILDVGIMFPDPDMPGVDLVLPDFTYLRENADRVDAVILTHGHEDHTGGLAFLLRDFPVDVYGSELTLGLGPQPGGRGRPGRAGEMDPGPRRRAPADRPLRRRVHPGHPLGAPGVRHRLPHPAGDHPALG